MTLSNFLCSRCKGTTLRHSRRKGWMQRVLTPPPIFRYYRCADCADRYPAIGYGEKRIVVQHRAQEIVLVGTMVVLVAVAIAAIMGFFALR